MSNPTTLQIMQSFCGNKKSRDWKESVAQQTCIIPRANSIVNAYVVEY